MPAAPPKKPALTALSRAATKLVVWLGNSEGSAPSSVFESEELVPTRIERTAGGGRLNSMTLEYLLSKDQEHVVDKLSILPLSNNRQIEVREVDSIGRVRRVLAWGKLAAQPIHIGDTETVSFTVRIEKHHFGEPLGKTPWWNPITSAVVELDRPLIFNAEIDDKITLNRSDKEWTDRNDAYVFFDSAAINTAAARTTHGQTPAKWRLFQAVHTLCWLCNPDETFIINPTRADCSIQLGEIDADHERLKNLALESGKYLPELLDQLLEPFGCSWTIDIELDPDTDRSTRRFRFFRRNFGTEKELFLQRPGETLDPVKSNVPDLNLNYDIANLANRIIGCTSRKQREGTWPLYFGWPVSEDSLDRENLTTLSATAKAHPHAGHKLVLNESGAWTGLRPEITATTDLTAVFDGDPTLPTCRKLKPCLSQVTDAASNQLESRGIWLEWLDPADATWKKPKWSFSVLQLECGIWLETIPEELWTAIQDDPTTTGVRVTATIEGDTRLYATAERDDESPNFDDITLWLNLSDKFHDRQVHTSSIFYSDAATADVTNDLIQLQAYVSQVRGLEDAAELSCSAILEGIDHPEYQIGDLITRVNGRNLELSRNNPGLFVDKRYLQIVGITYDLKDSQRMELLLESFDEESAF